MASSSQAPNHQKNGKGRQKVRMEKMENKSNLQVTFSKRRYGLFKKASELCTLTGCEMGIIVFSPGKKVFSFGHPSVHKVFEDCFANEEGEGTRARNNTVLMPPPLQMRWDERLLVAHRTASVAEQNMQLSEVEMRMEMEKKTTVVLEEREKEMVGYPSIKEMMDPELVELSAFLNTLKQSIMITMSNINRGVLSPPALNRVPMEMGNPGSNLMANLALNPMGGMGEEGFGPQL